MLALTFVRRAKIEKTHESDSLTMNTLSFNSCRSSIHGKWYRKLEAEQKVEFSIEEGPKGLQAANVVPLA